MNQEATKHLLLAQKEEIEGYHVYNYLASRIKNPENTKVLKEIAGHEMKHYEILKKYSKQDVKPSKLRILAYRIMSRTLGLTFSLRLMEKGEQNADHVYSKLKDHIPEVAEILKDEETHEKKLIGLINEESLKYIGSIVLGLNDALVELTGALAGFTFAIQNSRTIALIGLITGISASFSMAASEFLSQRQEENTEEAIKSSIYTGTAYIITVMLLIAPYLLFENHFINLGVMMSIALLIILCFNFYIAVAKDLEFRKRFLEMAAISLGVATISFGIGYIVKTFLGLEI
ncbi:MAG: VIT1/CCC1 transporter family protein [Candidatus Gracilibacteria bacterium]|nr:VIT1/CCC1 transporter family protein [Candidatus Gracilibacteria bacterium]